MTEKFELDVVVVPVSGGGGEERPKGDYENPFFDCYECKAKLCITCRTTCDRCGNKCCDSHHVTKKCGVYLCLACCPSKKKEKKEHDPYFPPHRACVDRWLDQELHYTVLRHPNALKYARDIRDSSKPGAVLWMSEGTVGSKRPFSNIVAWKNKPDNHPFMDGFDQAWQANDVSKNTVFGIKINEHMLDMSFIRWKTIPNDKLLLLTA